MSMCRCGDAIFSEHQMTTDQYSLIRAVQRNAGIRQADLGNEVFADPNTITAMVSLLEKRGILRREPCPTDGRARRLHVTPTGNRVMKRLSANWEPMRQELEKCFAGAAGQKALEIMDRVSEAMTEGRKEILANVVENEQARKQARRAVGHVGAKKTRQVNAHR